MADNEELTAQRQQEFAKFIRFSTWAIVITAVVLSVVIVGFVA
ncbi:MAG: hypothetical protein P8X75_10655 [Limibacillus sp.]|jgi:hypothetical protein